MNVKEYHLYILCRTAKSTPFGRNISSNASFLIQYVCTVVIVGLLYALSFKGRFSEQLLFTLTNIGWNNKSHLCL